MSVIKKVIVYKDELPAVDLDTRSYNIRYRLISEDKNRISPWSKFYNVVTPTVTPIAEYSIAVDNSNDLVTVTWNKDQIPELGDFDIWVKWVGNHDESNYPWAFVATILTNQYAFVFPTSIPDPVNGGTELPKKVRIAVQRPTYPKEKENYPTVSEITVFQTNLTTI
jgi:hypothetical protein